MGFKKGNSFFFYVYLFFLADLCYSEFVPVYLWSSESIIQPVPGLTKISHSSFKDDLIHKLKSNPTILVFAEQSLSPEDFGHRDSSGNIAFPYLSKVRKTSKISYLPYVQNPIKAVKHLSEEVTEISIEDLVENQKVPDAKILIIQLNDAKENEQRFDMLKRHDAFISSVYDDVLQKHDNVLALYTAHHASWIGSGDVHSRKARALLAADDVGAPSILFENNTIYFYSSRTSIQTKLNNNQKPEIEYITMTYTAHNDSSKISLIGTGTSSKTNANLTVDFRFIKTVGGYWYMQTASVVFGDLTIKSNTNTTIYAPWSFSYACGNQTFKNATAGFAVQLDNFQVQPLYQSTRLSKQNKFDDPYNCVGFTTIPIWSGIFVTLILLLIMSFGLTMMMDIKTMDRFDDAKGKTITINVSE